MLYWYQKRRILKSRSSYFASIWSQHGRDFQSEYQKVFRRAKLNFRHVTLTVVVARTGSCSTAATTLSALT
jgi:hypothetical protein